VARYTANKLGISEQNIITGSELNQISDQALVNRVKQIEIFSEVEPNQKERIILALRKGENVVGYIGDGINDVTAMHAADVSISVESAVDAAKEVANIVLLEKDLLVLADGVKAGRKTFANTLKYVFMCTSANFGNMFSMAGASLFLPFLPLLPKQVLMTNLLTDMPEMAIASDSVDEAWVKKPVRWDIHFIRRFMMIFGLISSIFDYMTFGVLLWIGASQDLFRTTWFVESVVSASSIVLVIRTFKPFYRSRPSNALLFSVLGIIAFTLLLPIMPFAKTLGFTPLSKSLYIIIFLIVGLYIVSVEGAKKYFLHSKPYPPKLEVKKRFKKALFPRRPWLWP